MNIGDLYQLFLSCSGVSTDTRVIKQDSIFFALKGGNFDGNKFAEEALIKGAKYAVVDNITLKGKDKIFIVENTLETLQNLANYHRKQMNIPVIGITGSNGKTTTKELIYAVLSQHFNIFATVGNFNNHIGVPLSLLSINENHEMAIIEMGANHLNEIQELCEIAEPNYGILTNIGNAHLEGFGGIEGVKKTKKELYDFIEKCKGTLFVNGDDEVLDKLRPKHISTITYGESEKNEFVLSISEMNPFLKFRWSKKEYNSNDISTYLVGQYNLMNIAAAVSIADYFGVPKEKIEQGISNYSPSNNRSQLQTTEAGNKLIIDAYNANPSSMKVAIENFNQLEANNKLVILGDMLELGEYSQNKHQEIRDILTNHNITAIMVGVEFAKTDKSDNQSHFNSTKDVIEHLKENKINNTMILIKGSRGLKLETLVEYL